MKANTDAEGHRILRVGFDANVAPGLDWSFEPESESVRLRTGKTVTVYFPRAQPQRQPGGRPRHLQRDARKCPGNISTRSRASASRRSISGPHESAEWPVVFFLDPALEKDESMARVDSITLSYTLFAPPSEKPAPARSADRAGPAG